MYFPYLRGRQYELLALRELVESNLLTRDVVIPVIEPVKLSPTLVNVLEDFSDREQNIAIIRNPAVGTFFDDWNDVEDISKKSGYRKKFIDQCENSKILKALILRESADELLEQWRSSRIDWQDILVICDNRDGIGLYAKYFEDSYPRYTLMPGEGTFKRKLRGNRVLLDDKFNKKARNADYKTIEDEFFSDDHLYYEDDGYIGFSDYSIIGDEYNESGFAPYAVAIHVVYFDEDESLRVRHFVSDSNEDISNTAKKFYQALYKLRQWYESMKDKRLDTKGMITLLRHYDEQTYPGLGTVKKLSLMHHIELMNNFIKGRKA